MNDDPLVPVLPVRDELLADLEWLIQKHRTTENDADIARVIGTLYLVAGSIKSHREKQLMAHMLPYAEAELAYLKGL